MPTPHDPLARTMLDDGEFQQATQEIYRRAQSDPRGTVAQASSLIEEQIANVWRQVVHGEIEQFERLTYAKKVDAICSKQLVGPGVCSELKTLGQIRNRLVHDWRSGTNFDSPRIAPLVDSLEMSYSLLKSLATADLAGMEGMIGVLAETRAGRWGFSVQMALQLLHTVVAHTPTQDR